MNSKLHAYLPNMLISIVLVFAALAALLLNFFTAVILDRTTYTDVMYKNNVDKVVFDEINDYFDKQYAHTGIDAKVFKSAVNQQEISAAIFAYIDSTFEYMVGKTSKKPELKFDFGKIEDSLNKDYQRWAEENNAKIDDKAKKNIEQTMSEVKTVINNKLDVMMLSYINKSGSAADFVHNHYGQLKTLRYASIGFAAVLIILLVIINRRYINTVFYWVGCSGFAAGVIMLIPSIYLKATKYFDGLILKNDAIYTSFTTSLYNILDQTILCGIVIVVLSVIFFFVNFAMYRGMFRYNFAE